MPQSNANGQYDVIVIGAGPGGYVCAIRAAQLGLRTACVESRPTLGGTCLNIGCIPSKALLQSSELFAEARGHLSAHGVKVGKVSLDLPQMMAHKDSVVQANVQGVEFLFKKNRIDWLKGSGRITDRNTVRVTDASGKSDSYTAGAIVIATGSDSTPLRDVEIDEERIVTSTGALDLSKVPKSMVVVGGGYIGLEMGSVWQRLGTEVTIVEYLERILPGMDAEVSRLMQRILAKQGLIFRTSSKVTAARRTRNGVKLTVAPAHGGEDSAEEIETDVLLVSIGRRPFTDGLGLEALGVSLDERGRVVTDPRFQTTVPGIFAIGDVIAGPMLAHKAEDDGIAVAEIIAGQAGHVNYEAVPAVVYTFPEAAEVGRNEEQLKRDGVDFRVGRFPFQANGRARAMGVTDGFVKVLADAVSDRILGVQIVGPEAGTMIAEATLAIEFAATAEDLARTSHAHPTLPEAMREAALAVDRRPLHL